MRKIILFITGLLFTPVIFSQPVDGVYYKDINMNSAFPYYLNNWEFRQAGDLGWKPAIVPGTIIDNFANLSDWSDPSHPYYGDNEKMYQWIGEKDWEFHTHLRVNANLFEKGSYEICFEGLSTFADVFVNDIKYQTGNAFIPLRITDLTFEELDIRIVFHSTLLMAKKLEGESAVKLPGGERVYVRAPQYEFGWDWGPRFINMGITKPVKLIMHPARETVISDLGYSIKKTAKNNENVIFFLYGKTGQDSVLLHFNLYLNGKNVDGFEKTYSNKLDNVLLYSLENPETWWPNGSGVSNYYELDLRFTKPGDTSTLAHRHFYYAHCTIHLEQEKDRYGESFSFLVNGKNIYAKGANYIPDDSFHPGKNTAGLITLAKEANMNLLRVWGGGTYPYDEFYVECMKKGIMVWQDFMFACAMYPAQSENFDIKEEVYTQYERISWFNNIAVWCGNNENDEGWKNWGWQKELEYSPEDSARVWRNYVGLFDSVIPYAYHRFYKLDNYIPSSPKYGWGRKESMTHGDSHYWGVWWGLQPFEKYEEKVPRFMSEFGMQGMPQPSTLKKIIPDSAMNFGSPLFKNHQKHPTGYQTLNHYLNEYLLIPDTMEDYIYATQILQAEALITAIEAQRRSRPYCMGSLLWQLNDCWPVTSWSLVDYDLKSKIAFDAVRDVFMPVILSVAKGTDAYEIYLVNDLLNTIEGKLDIKIVDFYGSVMYSKTLDVVSNGGSSKIVFKLPFKNLKGLDLTLVYLNLNFSQTNAQQNEDVNFYTKNYHFVKLKDLKLPPPQIIITHGHSCYNIEAKTYCPFIVLPSDNQWHFFSFLSQERGAVYGYDISETSIPWLDELIKNPARIKTLNSLLNK